MATHLPPLPPWSWMDLEGALTTLASTPAQRSLLAHFLGELGDDLPSDPQTILREAMCIAIAMANTQSATGIDPRLSPPSLALS